MAASEAGNTELVNLLLDHGADVNIQDKQGRTAYSLASDPAIQAILAKHNSKPF
jgi:ankyrin repeat protein